MEWTLYAGVTFVRCTVCLPEQLVLEGFDLPSDSEDPGYAFARHVEGVELRPGGGVVACEGGAAKETAGEDHELPF